MKRKQQTKLPFGTVPNPINLKDIGRAINAGVPQDKAEKLLAKSGENKFTAAIDALEVRVNRHDLADVRTPDKYLAATLAEIAHNDEVIKALEAEPARVKKHISSQRVALLESFRERKRQSAEGLLRESPEADQKSSIAHI